MKILTFPVVCILLLASTMQAQQTYDGYQAFKDIKEGWLVVQLPGFEKKLNLLDSLLNAPDLSDKSRDALLREQQRTLTDRDALRKWYPLAFDSLYEFSRVAFISSEELRKFEAGELPARGGGGEPVWGIPGQPFIYATLRGIYGDPFTFSSPDHLRITYPIPEKIEVPEIYGLFMSFGSLPAWMEDGGSDARTIYAHVVKLNRRFNKIYDKHVQTY